MQYFKTANEEEGEKRPLEKNVFLRSVGGVCFMLKNALFSTHGSFNI